jgi:hypothetical protein
MGIWCALHYRSEQPTKGIRFFSLQNQGATPKNLKGGCRRNVHVFVSFQRTIAHIWTNFLFSLHLVTKLATLQHIALLTIVERQKQKSNLRISDEMRYYEILTTLEQLAQMITGALDSDQAYNIQVNTFLCQKLLSLVQQFQSQQREHFEGTFPATINDNCRGLTLLITSLVESCKNVPFSTSKRLYRTIAQQT